MSVPDAVGRLSRAAALMSSASFADRFLALACISAQVAETTRQLSSNTGESTDSATPVSNESHGNVHDFTSVLSGDHPRAAALRRGLVDALTPAFFEVGMRVQGSKAAALSVGTGFTDENCSRFVRQVFAAVVQDAEMAALFPWAHTRLFACCVAECNRLRDVENLTDVLESDLVPVLQAMLSVASHGDSVSNHHVQLLNAATSALASLLSAVPPHLIVDDQPDLQLRSAFSLCLQYILRLLGAALQCDPVTWVACGGGVSRALVLVLEAVGLEGVGVMEALADTLAQVTEVWSRLPPSATLSSPSTHGSTTGSSGEVGSGVGGTSASMLKAFLGAIAQIRNVDADAQGAKLRLRLAIYHAFVTYWDAALACDSVVEPLAVVEPSGTGTGNSPAGVAGSVETSGMLGMHKLWPLMLRLVAGDIRDCTDFFEDLHSPASRVIPASIAAHLPPGAIDATHVTRPSPGEVDGSATVPSPATDCAPRDGATAKSRPVQATFQTAPSESAGVRLARIRDQYDCQLSFFHVLMSTFRHVVEVYARALSHLNTEVEPTTATGGLIPSAASVSEAAIARSMELHALLQEMCDTLMGLVLSTATSQVGPTLRVSAASLPPPPSPMTTTQAAATSAWLQGSSDAPPFPPPLSDATELTLLSRLLAPCVTRACVAVGDFATTLYNSSDEMPSHTGQLFDILNCLRFAADLPPASTPPPFEVVYRQVCMVTPGGASVHTGVVADEAVTAQSAGDPFVQFLPFLQEIVAFEGCGAGNDRSGTTEAPSKPIRFEDDGEGEGSGEGGGGAATEISLRAVDVVVEPPVLLRLCSVLDAWSRTCLLRLMDAAARRVCVASESELLPEHMWGYYGAGVGVFRVACEKSRDTSAAAPLVQLTACTRTLLLLSEQIVKHMTKSPRMGTNPKRSFPVCLTIMRDVMSCRALLIEMNTELRLPAPSERFATVMAQMRATSV